MIRVAFHAPMKSPCSPVPSGDREMARNLMAAIAAGGARVDLVSELKTHDKAGDADAQARARDLATAEIARLTHALGSDPPALWVTYHNYYKAPDLIGPAVSRALGLKQVSFAELWEMQMLLEPFSARLAALRGHEDVKQLIGENVLKLADCLDDDQAVILNDIEFHRLLAVATGNEALALSTAPIGALLFAATQELYALVPQARQRLLGAHQRIAAAVVAGDERQAESWMEKHIRDFRRGYELAEISIDAPITLDPRALRAD